LPRKGVWATEKRPPWPGDYPRIERIARNLMWRRAPVLGCSNVNLPKGPGKPDRATTTRSRCRIFPRFNMHHSSLIILPGPRPKPKACLFHFRHPLFGLPLCLRVSVVCCVSAFPLSAFRFFPPPFPIRAIRDSWANLIPSQTSATDWQRLGEPNALASSWQPRTNQTLGWPCFLNFCRVVSKVRTCSDGIVRTAQIM